MRNRHSTLLAGVATLALLTGTSLALAQAGLQPPQGDHQTAAPSMSAPNASQTQATKPDAAPMQSTKQGPGAGQQAQKGDKTGAPSSATAAKTMPANQPAMAKQDAGKTAKDANHIAQQIDRNKMSRRTGNHTAQQERGHGKRMNTAERRNDNLKGLQGNAALPMQGAGGNVSLTGDQRASIRNSVIDARGAPKVGHVDFNVRVGTLVPRRHVHAIPVPETLVRIDPRWRGFLYFVVRDEVVIVNPHDMRIVAVVAV